MVTNDNNDKSNNRNTTTTTTRKKSLQSAARLEVWKIATNANDQPTIHIYVQKYVSLHLLYRSTFIYICYTVAEERLFTISIQKNTP